MHPVLGTMMPEICEAPHLPVFSFIHHSAPHLIKWDVFITFLRRGVIYAVYPVSKKYTIRFMKYDMINTIRYTKYI